MATLTQAEAKRQFLTLCREAIADGLRAYVKDKADRSYLTLDPEKRHLSGPVLDLTAQFFKDNFARCSSLIKDGICFRLTLRGENRCIYARRHTKYSDPCDSIIERWQEQVASNAQTKQEESALMAILKRADRKGETNHEELLTAISRLVTGVARLAIGHRPFEEGQLPGDS